ncbi:uncharacterized protein PG986_006368 [Apiospora aurea]|uniref:Uncharacterized protein n=1 Tax=Apiospora aurea TaxID=335848 RepID=A0ABR1QLR8_9PEZI
MLALLPKLHFGIPSPRIAVPRAVPNLGPLLRARRGPERALGEPGPVVRGHNGNGVGILAALLEDADEVYATDGRVVGRAVGVALLARGAAFGFEGVVVAVLLGAEEVAEGAGGGVGVGHDAFC